MYFYKLTQLCLTLKELILRLENKRALTNTTWQLTDFWPAADDTAQKKENQENCRFLSATSMRLIYRGRCVSSIGWERGSGRGWEFIRRRLQSKEVIIFSRSVARSLIKVAAERNQQGPHQFYVSSFFLRGSLLLYRRALRLRGLIVQPNNRNF